MRFEIKYSTSEKLVLTVAVRNPESSKQTVLKKKKKSHWSGFHNEKQMVRTFLLMPTAFSLKLFYKYSMNIVYYRH